VLQVSYSRVDAQGRSSPARVASTKNIGVGGAFLVTNEALATGLRLRVRLDASVPDIEAEVRWIAQPPHEPGVGVKFLPLTPTELLALASFLGEKPPGTNG
jgi:hypothetical protein